MSASAKPGENQNPQSAVPQSWGWYGEAIKWFVAIAAALLAFGFDAARNGSMAGLYWWVYLAGAFGLSLCVMAGLFAYLQLLGASNVLELPNRTGEDNDKFEGFHRRLAASYKVCVGALAAGIVLSVIPWVGSVWPRAENTLSPVVIAKAEGADDLLITRRRSEITEILVSRPNGSLAWAHAPPLHPKEQPSGSCGSCHHRD